MRIFITADLHANILAAEAAVSLAKELGSDIHIHIGDAVDLGPWPEETLQFLLSEDVVLIKGNHEEFHTSPGIAPHVLERADDGELDHYRWTSSQLSAESLAAMEVFPYFTILEHGGVKAHFQHFPLKDGRITGEHFEVDPQVLSGTFESPDADLYFFGHIHQLYLSDSQPNYICPGGSGVNHKPGSGMMAGQLDLLSIGYEYTPQVVPWNLEAVRKDVHNRCISNRDWLLENMFKT